MGPALDFLVRRKACAKPALAVSVRLLKERVALLLALQSQSQGNAETLEDISTELRLPERYVRCIQEILKQA
jgi:hypothetical protein